LAWPIAETQSLVEASSLGRFSGRSAAPLDPVRCSNSRHAAAQPLLASSHTTSQSTARNTPSLVALKAEQFALRQALTTALVPPSMRRRSWRSAHPEAVGVEKTLQAPKPKAAAASASWANQPDAPGQNSFSEVAAAWRSRPVPSSSFTGQPLSNLPATLLSRH